MVKGMWVVVGVLVLAHDCSGRVRGRSGHGGSGLDAW